MHIFSLETNIDDMTNQNREKIDFFKANMALQFRLAQSYPSISCSIDTEVILASEDAEIKMANGGDHRQSRS